MSLSTNINLRFIPINQGVTNLVNKVAGSNPVTASIKIQNYTAVECGGCTY